MLFNSVDINNIKSIEYFFLFLNFGIASTTYVVSLQKKNNINAT